MHGSWRIALASKENHYETETKKTTYIREREKRKRKKLKIAPVPRVVKPVIAKEGIPLGMGGGEFLSSYKFNYF